MALTLSILKLTRKTLTLFFFFLYFAIFGADDPPAYAHIEAVVRDKNISSLFVIKEQLKKKFGSRAALSTSLESRLTREIAMPLLVIEEIKKRFVRTPNIGEFLGMFFFPHSSFENTVKTNFNQLPFVERALVLISADLGFKPAKNILLLASNEKINLDKIQTEEDLQSLLSIPFMAENGMVIQKFKKILNNTAKQNAFFSRVQGSEPIILVNAGYISQFLKRPEIAESLFEEAFTKGSRRGAIEHGFMILEKDLTRETEFIGRMTHLRLESYAFWKLAQYYRFGTSTPRDLLKANRNYLHALSGGHEFPEIFYDAGDFAEYFASSQTDIAKRVRALEQALEHYRLAAEGGIGEAYRKQDEILNKLSILRSVDWTDRSIALASQAAAHYFVDAANILRAKHIEIPTTQEWKNLEQSISIYMNLLKLVKKCSIEF
ncbi:MAG: hypothetical protein WCK82_13525 [Bacteroidota bacterium]